MKPAEQIEYVHGQVTRPGFVVLDGETEERSFNNMGAQGWMLYPPNGTIAYFYRPVSLVQQLETKDQAQAMYDAIGLIRQLGSDDPHNAMKPVDYPPANTRPGKAPSMPARSRGRR